MGTRFIQSIICGYGRHRFMATRRYYEQNRVTISSKYALIREAYMVEPKLVKTWEELSSCTSETHTLDIDLEYGCGWIKPKVASNEDALNGRHYLSTHTFYGSTYKWSTALLQKCGFNVILDNWDA
jgi:cystathionine beta-lyase/cystathionine gamma-synthase